MLAEEFRNSAQPARQVLLVAIDVSEDFTFGFAQTAIDCVVHAAVLFDERFDACVVRKPIKRAVVGDGILDDMFEFHSLIRDGGDAKFKPLRSPKAGRYD